MASQGRISGNRNKKSEEDKSSKEESDEDKEKDQGSKFPTMKYRSFSKNN